MLQPAETGLAREGAGNMQPGLQEGRGRRGKKEWRDTG